MYILSGVSNRLVKLQSTVRTAVTAALLSLPLNKGCDTFVRNINKEFPAVEITLKAKSVRILEEVLTSGYETEKQVNIRGGVTHSFKAEQLEKLRQTLLESGIQTNYTMPVDTAIAPYIPSTGQFGSIRPQGRAHLGIDIYPRLYGRKPKQPVAVLSATDGIVVSVKQSPEYDPKNLIANNIKIMAPDGKIYSYDHLGRPEDYKNSKYTPLKKLGEIVHAGDTLGTVGKTGETAVWHLHFAVEDLEAQKAQLKNPLWQKLFKKHSVYATPRGQVDPLNENKAGEISKYLNKYKIEKGEKVDYADNL